MEIESVDFEKLQELVEKYPIGSKILCAKMEGGQDKTLPCKVVGYSTFTYRVLVYNPEIAGIGGNRWCVDQDGKPITREHIMQKYGKHCAFVSDRETLCGIIVGGVSG